MRSSLRLGFVAFVLAACSGRQTPSSAPPPPPSAPVVLDAGATVVEPSIPAPSSCAVVLCAPDTRCEETHGVASCVPIMHPHRTFCGGIAGIRCPDGSRCVDDPDDGCDPARGGRDCGGVCEPATAPTAPRR